MKTWHFLLILLVACGLSIGGSCHHRSDVRHDDDDFDDDHHGARGIPLVTLHLVTRGDGGSPVSLDLDEVELVGERERALLFLRAVEPARVDLDARGAVPLVAGAPAARDRYTTVRLRLAGARAGGAHGDESLALAAPVVEAWLAEPLRLEESAALRLVLDPKRSIVETRSGAVFRPVVRARSGPHRGPIDLRGAIEEVAADSVRVALPDGRGSVSARLAPGAPVIGPYGETIPLRDLSPGDPVRVLGRAAGGGPVEADRILLGDAADSLPRGDPAPGREGTRAGRTAARVRDRMRGTLVGLEQSLPALRLEDAAGTVEVRLPDNTPILSVRQLGDTVRTRIVAASALRPGQVVEIERGAGGRLHAVAFDGDRTR